MKGIKLVSLMLVVVAFGVGAFFVKIENAINIEPVLAAGTKEAFDYLSASDSETKSYCGLQPVTVDEFLDEESIQGACCGAMDFHRYQEQVEGLRKYKGVSNIPEDPYNIPVDLAKKLFDFQSSIVLTDDQQKVYDQAMEISHEGGPCCCKCWRWTAFEGLAKHLIVNEQFNSQEIADAWDLLDGCGGPGHAGEQHNQSATLNK